MSERPLQILKAVCLLLGVLLVVRLAPIAKRANPLAHSTIPAVPVLEEESAPASNTSTNHSVAHTTNQESASLSHTNLPLVGTNLATTNKAQEQTNGAVAQHDKTAGGTNVLAEAEAPTGKTNAAVAESGGQTNQAERIVSGSPQTNSHHAELIAATNETAVAGTNKAGQGNGTNSPAIKNAMNRSIVAAGIPPGVPFPGGLPPGMGAKKAAPLSVPLQARIDRIIESELLGQVIHPLPMLLMGIAGDVAFLRAPNGQTGLVKPGDSLGDLKLIRIGTNRVLVQADGTEQELMIFSGLGGESLIPKPQGSTNEHTAK
jgi:hypothetical protein